MFEKNIYMMGVFNLITSRINVWQTPTWGALARRSATSLWLLSLALSSAVLPAWTWTVNKHPSWWAQLCENHYVMFFVSLEGTFQSKRWCHHVISLIKATIMEHVLEHAELWNMYCRIQMFKSLIHTINVSSQPLQQRLWPLFFNLLLDNAKSL